MAGIRDQEVRARPGRFTCLGACWAGCRMAAALLDSEGRLFATRLVRLYEIGEL
jgi:hypothetical protein